MLSAITVDIYCRVATYGPDTEARLDEQEASCRMYCARHDLTVGAVHREVWSDIYYRERPGLTALRGPTASTSYKRS